MEAVKMTYKWTRRDTYSDEINVLRKGDSSSIAHLLKKDYISNDMSKKLSPNYIPPNPRIVMDLRSEMIQKRPWFQDYRKRIVKFKNIIREINNSNRELIKLKQHLNNRNLKNNFTMKLTDGEKNDDIKMSTLNQRIVKSAKLQLSGPVNGRKENDSLTSLINVVARAEMIPKLKLHIHEDMSSSNVTSNEQMIKDTDYKQFQVTSPEEALKCNALVEKMNASYKEKLARRIVYIWKAFVKRRLEEKRKNKIEEFFDMLYAKKQELGSTKGQPENSKGKVAAKDSVNYYHRFQVQKNIIALQKIKLEEQNRLIEQLKYKKLGEIADGSVDVLREELKSTVQSFPSNLKPRVRCLKNELRKYNSDDNDDTLVVNSLRVPQFLKKMEQRARERSEKHALIQERKRQIEEERVRQKQQAEIEKLEMDKEEHQRRMEELRKKRRQERLETIRKKQYEARMRSLTVMATLHYEKKLLKKYGIEPFKRLLLLKRESLVKSTRHYELRLKRKMFDKWFSVYEKVNTCRLALSEEHRKKCVYRNVFDTLKTLHKEYILKWQVAQDYCDFKLACRTFAILKRNSAKEKERYRLKCQQADQYYNNTIMVKILAHWRTLPALESLRREQDARKARWRKRVQCVIPDYSPVRNGHTYDE